VRVFSHWSFPAFALFLLLIPGGVAPAVPQGHELLISRAQHAEALGDADRREIFAQPGLKAAPDGEGLDFVDAECPAIGTGGGDILAWTEDLGGDGCPEVFNSPGSACMFGDGAAQWKPHNPGDRGGRGAIDASPGLRRPGDRRPRFLPAGTAPGRQHVRIRPQPGRAAESLRRSVTSGQNRRQLLSLSQAIARPGPGLLS
jgi:hypothetical protein